VRYGKRHARLDPQLVLWIVRLRFDGEFPTAEHLSGNGEKERPHLGEAIERIEAAVVRAMAIRPLVVADRVDERVLEGVVQV